VADLVRCEVLHPAIGGQLQALAARLEQLEARARIPQIEVAVAGETVALVFRHLDPLSGQDLATLRNHAAHTGMHVYLQPGGPDSVQLLAPGESVLAYSLPQQSIEVVFRPTDFTQVNTAINEQMVARVLALLEPEASEHVLDLFCGLGNFTLPLARHSASVTGVEGDAGLVRRAHDNALRNGLDNVTFYSADLAGSVEGASWTTSAYDKVLLDPPRSGAAAVMPLLGAIGARRIVYVSCHPGTLARDAGMLVHESRYRLCAAGVMDMFPHTAHVESIALFERA
jgi:23S rRNA (uracil1939-C5)-methyltransferase